MVQAICEKTGIAFEAKSKRTKNHPEIMEIINESNKDGWYNSALQAIKEGREAGLETIEEFVELLGEARKAAQESRDAKWGAVLAEKREEKESKRQRFLLNNALRAKGYRWANMGFESEEDADAFDINLLVGDDWQLFDPEGNPISLNDAKKQIGW